MKRTEMTHVKEKEILEAALLGYQSQIGDLQDKMREIVARLNPEPEIVTTGASPLRAVYKTKAFKKDWAEFTRGSAIETKPKRHTMSEEGRARIAAAQKKRWRLLKRAAA